MWNENGILVIEGQSDMKPIRYEMKTVSCKRGPRLTFKSSFVKRTIILIQSVFHLFS